MLAALTLQCAAADVQQLPLLASTAGIHAGAAGQLSVPGEGGSLNTGLGVVEVLGKPVASPGDVTIAGKPASIPISTLSVLTLLMSACSGLGALPFFFVGSLTPWWSGAANSIASGVMLAASFDLIYEGQSHGAVMLILGVACGTLFVRSCQRFLARFEQLRFDQLEGADARKVVLILGVMTAHAFGEGSGVGVSFRYCKLAYSVPCTGQVCRSRCRVEKGCPTFMPFQRS